VLDRPAFTKAGAPASVTASPRRPADSGGLIKGRPVGDEAGADAAVTEFGSRWQLVRSLRLASRLCLSRIASGHSKRLCSRNYGVRTVIIGSPPRLHPGFGANIFMCWRRYRDDHRCDPAVRRHSLYRREPEGLPPRRRRAGSELSSPAGWSEVCQDSSPRALRIVTTSVRLV
jgi:hypothetical protein